MPTKISLKQFLIRTGNFEKVYDCVEAIRKGRVTINGKAVTNPNFFFNPDKHLVKLDGNKVKRVIKFYFVMNKPSDYICQKSEYEKNIYDILKNKLPAEIANSLFAVGRLDKDTEGLMIITNDGALSHKINNPKNKIIKKYYAVLEKPADINKIKILEKGIEINIDNEDYKTKKCNIKIVGEKELYISISEGKKRQIRKMFEVVNNKVTYMKRVSIGGLQLGNLKAREIKEITLKELMKNLFQ